MKVRKANQNDINSILALAIQNKIKINSSGIKGNISEYNILMDQNGRTLGFSQVKFNKNQAIIEEMCMKNSIKGKGFEEELLRPIKSKYKTLKYKGKNAERLGFKGGEYVRHNRKALYNNKGKLKTRKENLDGVEYLVAPVVMVREQVLNGELLPAEEISKSTIGWNGRPVVVYHPKDKEGNDTIANSPDAIPKYEVGKVFNVSYEEETTKLKGEIWVDISKAKRKNKDTREALKMIRNSEELEVSTGYIVNDRVEEDGEFDGVEYNAIQKEILPDHLALLPQEIGACSWEDGAGVRNNSSKLAKWITNLVNNLSSKQSISSMLTIAIKEEYDDFDWVCDTIHDPDTNKDFVIFRTRAIYEDDKFISEGKQYALDYSFDEDGNVILGDSLVEVESTQVYIEKNEEEQILNRKQNLVRDVIANSKGKLGRKDKTTLLNCNEDALIAMLPEEKRKQYTTNKGKQTLKVNKDIVANLCGDRKFITNEGEEEMVKDLLLMSPEDATATISEITDTEQLEEIAMHLEEVIGIADVIGGMGGDLEASEDFTSTIDTILTNIEDLLIVVDETIAGGGDAAGEGEEGDEGAATNADISDITDPTGEGEEETVAALQTMRRKRGAKMRANANAKTPAKTTGKKQMSVSDYINSIPDADAREFIKNGMAEAKAHRASLISTLSSSKNCSFSEKELKGMETNQLEKLSKMVSTPSRRTTTNSHVDYSINGRNNSQEEDKGYTPLSINMFKKGDK